MSLISDALTWFDNAFSPSQISTEVFPKVDVDLASKELKIEARAFESGQQEKPDSSNDDLDSNERMIVDYIYQKMITATDTYETQISGHTEQLQTHIGLINSNIKEVTHRSLTGLEVQMLKIEHSFIDTRKEYEQSLANFNTFKTKNNITRDPKYPTNKYAYYSFIISIFASESIMNTFFFAEGSEYGYLGGFMSAFIIGIINMSIGIILIGKPFRLFFEKRIAKRIFAAIATTLSIIIALSGNLLFAHYRNLFSENGQEFALKNALNSLIAHIYVTDLHSIILLFVGILACGLAAWKSANSDDLIPNYGHLDRIRKEKTSALHIKKEEALDIITDERDQKLEELEAHKEELVSAKNRFAHTLTRKNLFENLYANCLESLNASGNALLKMYRNSNLSCRKTPQPKYFDNEFKFKVNKNVKIDKNMTEAIEDVNTRYNKAIEEIDSCIDATFSFFNKKLILFQHSEY